MRKEIEKIVHNLLYHDSWESNDNETIYNNSLNQICQLVKERIKKVKELYNLPDLTRGDIELNDLLTELSEKGEKE